MSAAARPARPLMERNTVSGRPGKTAQQGSIFMGMLVTVAIVAILLMETGQVWSSVIRREREAQLLAQGNEIRRAIGLYYDVQQTYPKTLEELLLDKRQPIIKRYLRRLYKDPMDPTQEWGVVEGPGETIMGVFSQAKGQPLKRDNFRKGNETFIGQSSYQGWIFLYSPGQSNPP